MRFMSLFLVFTLFSFQGLGGDDLASVLKHKSQAFVTIYLDHGSWPKSRQDQVAYTQLLQDAVLEDELAFGFKIVRRYQSVPALAGWIQPPTFQAWLAKKKTGQSLIQSIDLDVGGRRANQASAGGGGLAQSVPLIGADTLHQMGITGQGIEIAVLDTGFDSDHPDLQFSLLSEACFCANPAGNCCPNGSATQTGSGSAEDDHGHGTHVTGIITSNGMVAGKGVAPDARITAVKMLDSTNSFNSSSDIVAALDWVHNNRPDVKIVSMSIFTFVSFSQACDNEFAWTQALFTAVENLVNRGVIVVTIAGNDGFSGALPAPGCLSNLITVGASNKSDGMYSGSNSHDAVAVLAPGQDIVSSAIGGGSTAFTGTSMACPHVAATAALFLQANPTLTQSEIVNALIDTGLPITDSFGRTKPRINARAAYDKLFASNGVFERWIPHVTTAGGGFKTFIHIYNKEVILKKAQDVMLVPFDSAGNQLTAKSLTVQPGQILREDAATLFDGEPVSHVAIVGPTNIRLNTAYQANAANAATAHAPEFSVAVTNLVFEPAEWDLVFDGMAVINVGQADAQVVVSQFDANGSIIDNRDYTVTQALGTHQKLLVLFSADFNQVAGAYFQIQSSQPSHIILLRGTYPGTSPAYLYQTVPLDTTTDSIILKTD